MEALPGSSEDTIPLSPSGARSLDGDGDLEAGVRPPAPVPPRRNRFAYIAAALLTAVAIIVIELLNRSHALALVLFFGGWLAWKNDLNGTWCFRRGSAFYWLQGHAVWHVLTMGALGCIYWFFRSEKISYS